MEKYDKNLKDFIHEQRLMSKPIDLDITRHILYQLANALKVLFEKNIVHRDLKPENILIRKNIDNKLEVAITDLGVSRMIANTEKSNMSYKGTRLWMAPEVQHKSKYGHPADVFSFGLIIMYMKAGANPINRNDSGNLIL